MIVLWAAFYSEINAFFESWELPYEKLLLMFLQSCKVISPLKFGKSGDHGTDCKMGSPIDNVLCCDILSRGRIVAGFFISIILE